MPKFVPRVLALLCAVGAAACISPALARPSDTAPNAPASLSPMTSHEKALHVLNRLGFGPRPGDVERVEAMGVDAWIALQLRPESIADPLVAPRLAGLPTLTMTSSDLFDTFEKPLREARRLRNAAAGTNAAASPASIADAGAAPDAGSMTAAAAEAAAAADEDFRRTIPPEKRPRRIIEELSAARVLRAAYSERQLNEVLVDFWMNHFNVFAAKGLDRVFITSFERDAVRPRIWGRFEDLLLATAKSPAMLVYLDNAQSVADPEHRPTPARARLGRFSRFTGFTAPAVAARPGALKRAGGLNENYARELMELHTLGVDGGFTQKDVTELARVLTGWSIDRARGEFLFRERVHDAGAKIVLGHRFPASGGSGTGGAGIEEGEAMIRILARQPATARHISREICQWLVSDQPPAALVDRVAKRFLATDGDLRETVKAVIESPEFFSRDTYRAKVKSPFEYVVSAIRASGAETTARGPLLREIARMGEPLYLCQPPTGYSDAGTAWVNTGALVARLNFALALASNRLTDTRVDPVRLLPGAAPTGSDRTVDAIAKSLLGGDLTAESRHTIEARLRTPSTPAEGFEAAPDLPLIAGLILGSPEFQRQ